MRGRGSYGRTPLWWLVFLVALVLAVSNGWGMSALYLLLRVV